MKKRKTKHKKGVKFDDKKPAMGYLPPLALLEVGKAFSAGEKKYGPWQYANGLSIVRCISGALRHIFQFTSGETYDKETNTHHLACAVANLLIGLNGILVDNNLDNRFQSWKKQKEH